MTSKAQLEKDLRSEKRDSTMLGYVATILTTASAMILTNEVGRIAHDGNGDASLMIGSIVVGGAITSFMGSRNANERAVMLEAEMLRREDIAGYDAEPEPGPSKETIL